MQVEVMRTQNKHFIIIAYLQLGKTHLLTDKKYCELRERAVKMQSVKYRN